MKIKNITVHTDLNYLKTMSGEDPDLMAEMIDIFNQQVVELRIELETLLNNQEYYTLGKVAHKAKTSVAIMGMSSLASQLKKLEENAKQSLHTNTYKDCIDTFRIETEEAIKELIEFKKRIGYN